jgi:hypothetical protein
MGGEIEITSKHDSGSTFTIFIPREVKRIEINVGDDETPSQLPQQRVS